MPSVGMRRSTRVFGARVLRSGRRMWTEPRLHGKYIRAANGGNEWIKLLDNSADGGGDAGDRFKDVWQENENSVVVDIDMEPKIEESALEGAVEVRNMDRMCGIVYRRKRKRAELTSAGHSEDNRFGKKFVRTQWKKKYRAAKPSEICGNFMGSANRFPQLAVVADESSCDSGYWISCFLSSVLSYMTRFRIGIRRLSAFVLLKPIIAAYSSGGVLFLQDSINVKNPGVCIISGSRFLIPVFAVDFSAIPFCFVQMHTSMHIRSAHLARLLVAQSLGSNEKDEKVTDVVDYVEKPSFQVPSGSDHSDCVAVASEISPGGDISYIDVLSHSAVGLPKSSIRIMQLRSSRNIQKRRSSLRRKRGRPPSSFRAQKASEALASDFFRIRHDGFQSPPAAPSHALRSLDKRSSTKNIKELKPTPGLLTQDMCFASCGGNLLIIEPDKCYREEGAIITLELSASKQWSLAVMKNGMKRYSLTAQKVMRPSSCNHFTHATVWAGDGGWKLEFPNKQDWLIFKELYKECTDRNLQAPATTVIPIPGVQEVPIPVDSNYTHVRPDSYITMEDDELTRALLRKSAYYDMDSDDEKWLNKFNDELYEGRELGQLITPEMFELVIDALEKGFHCNPDDYSEDRTAYDFCVHLERKEVVEAICNYWIKKRKQKCAALVRIFQLYQPRRTQVIPKSVLRKKRSFKRQASQVERGKQRTFLQAKVAERDALEQQNNVHKVQEAKAAAVRSEGLSVLKRQRAQMLMENADLATYKAMMALRIAEAAHIAEAPGTVASFFLG
ncbi:hypothetical protein Pfo_015717 [Paulownia fortunei]|nr:hypothetical protein Pfo_015717 [Paulownia fortunei]